MLDGLARGGDTAMARGAASTKSMVHPRPRLTTPVLTLLSGASLGAFGAAMSNGNAGLCYLIALVGGIISATLAGLATAAPVENLRGTGAKTQLLLGFLTLCLLVLGGLAVLFGGVSLEQWVAPPK